MSEEVRHRPLEIQRETEVGPATERTVVEERVHFIRWGPVFAGLVLALAIYLVLLALGVGVGITAAEPAAAAWWGAIALLISLFVGGYIAGMFTGAADVATSVTQGALVWALTLLLLAVLGPTIAALAGPEVMQLGLAQMADPAAAPAAGWWFVIGNILAFAAAALGAFTAAQPRRRAERREVRRVPA